MPHIKLKVTQKVLEQVERVGTSQMQIAIKGGSEDIEKAVLGANRDNKIVIPVSGTFLLVVGDSGAIWLSHQVTKTQTNDFQNLYQLLARRPDYVVTFMW